MEPIIVVTHVSKAYRKYRSTLSKLLEWILPFKLKLHNLLWVLKDINFNINRGESVGLIGINGAGKSTLLKLICDTTSPTEGQIKINGTVSALLELGLGFHADFTGRQNVYMSAQIMGLSQDQITQLMPSIEEFADIGIYIDEPVRVYSSGMLVRLAFSVATAVRPDILIVDEALSVGDIKFQQKCFNRIEKFKKEGTTLLFVTHDMNTLHTICDKAILLADGEVKYFGPTTDAVELYYGYLNRDKAIVSQKNDSSIATNNIPRFESKYCSLSSHVQSVNITSDNGDPQQFIYEGQNCTINIQLVDLYKYDDPHVGIRIQDRTGTVMFETNTFCQNLNLEKSIDLSKSVNLSIHFKNNLSPGCYTIAVGIEAGGHGNGAFSEVICLTERLFEFNVLRHPLETKNWAGLCNLHAEMKVN